MKRRVWFERHFEAGVHLDALPDIVERLRGTPARLEERVSGHGAEILTARADGAWSIQEHAGHLLDLEELWSLRLDDLEAGADVLHAADLTNRRTHQAQHNRRRIADLLREFRDARMRMVARIDAFPEPVLTRTALHPRLRQSMGVPDLAFFVAEHDDHHLAAIGEVLRLRG